MTDAEVDELVEQLTDDQLARLAARLVPHIASETLRRDRRLGRHS